MIRHGLHGNLCNPCLKTAKAIFMTHPFFILMNGEMGRKTGEKGVKTPKNGFF